MAELQQGAAFLEERHVAYVTSLGEKTNTFEHVATDHLRMSGVYWGLTAMALLGRDLRGEMRMDELVEWVLQCQHPGGGFGGNTGHDPHILYTLSALQILAIADALDRVDRDAVAAYVASLQQSDGSFFGDSWGEVDTRFSYCALSAIAILGKLHAEPPLIDVDKAARFVASCGNLDGGFGCIPGAESHAGQIFCCVGALSISGRLDLIDADLLGWWLAERQCDSGGLNGRPEKQADVCYSWWILSALGILGRVDWIDRQGLVSFILQCQDPDDGGIADRPGNMADVFHTFFGIAGLSLLGYYDQTGSGAEAGGAFAAYRRVDPIFALPVDLVSKLGLHGQTLLPSATTTPLHAANSSTATGAQAPALGTAAAATAASPSPEDE